MRLSSAIKQEQLKYQALSGEDGEEDVSDGGTVTDLSSVFDLEDEPLDGFFAPGPWFTGHGFSTTVSLSC
jgi:hypothetical protein